MNVFFWNTNKNESINTVINEIVLEYDISLIVLAEYVADADELISTMLKNGIVLKQYEKICERITIFGTLKNLEPKFDDGHSTIKVINNKDILCCIHLNSKIYGDNENQRNILINRFISEIQRVEKELNTENTIIVGDLNINPFDSSCIDARYIHGIPIFEDADRRKRKILEETFYMFYNPMWNFLGDFTKPYGTYYHSGNDTVNTFWNIYDQVIIRPAMRKRFVDSSLKIITRTEKRFLLDANGHPNKNISDHLPIIFEITEE